MPHPLASVDDEVFSKNRKGYFVETHNLELPAALPILKGRGLQDSRLNRKWSCSRFDGHAKLADVFGLTKREELEHVR